MANSFKYREIKEEMFGVGKLLGSKEQATTLPHIGILEGSFLYSYKYMNIAIHHVCEAQWYRVSQLKPALVNLITRSLMSFRAMPPSRISEPSC